MQTVSHTLIYLLQDWAVETLEIFATFLLTICMTQVFLPSRAVRHTRVKRLASFLGWGKKVEQLHVQPKPMQIRVGRLTVWTLTLHGHEPRNLGRKGPESKARFWHRHCRSGHRPQGARGVLACCSWQATQHCREWDAYTVKGNTSITARIMKIKSPTNSYRLPGVPEREMLSP